jgi:hypothetical protein
LDISDRHFHIVSITPQGVVLYESEYESAERSIDDFVELIGNVYMYQLGQIPETYRLELMDIAYAPETASVTLGYPDSLFKVFWSSCDGGCRIVERN